LTYYEKYKNIVSWMDGKEKLGIPIECNLDPIAECNLNCYFCITQRYLKTNRAEVGEMRKLPTDYMYRLVDFLSQWGVRGLCISGGGEPTLHHGVWGLPLYAKMRGMDVSMFTNGTNINPILIESMLLCRWIAFSIDAGNSEDYQKIKGADRFKLVINNLSSIANMRGNSKVDLCYKMLVLPENIDGIYQACKLAKEIGVQDFHVRPADFERWDIKGHKRLQLDRRKVEEQFALCHEEENENFHVYTVTHKFDPEFHVHHDFTRCLASPIIIPILTDGNAYLCVDRKMEGGAKLGSCFPDPEKILEWWGSDKHRNMIKEVNINNCTRCTWSQYNQQIEETVLKDGMCVNFP